MRQIGPYGTRIVLGPRRSESRRIRARPREHGWGNGDDGGNGELPDQSEYPQWNNPIVFADFDIVFYDIRRFRALFLSFVLASYLESEYFVVPLEYEISRLRQEQFGVLHFSQLGDEKTFAVDSDIGFFGVGIVEVRISEEDFVFFSHSVGKVSEFRQERYESDFRQEVQGVFDLKFRYGTPFIFSNMKSNLLRFPLLIESMSLRNSSDRESATTFRSHDSFLSSTICPYVPALLGSVSYSR